MGKWKKFHEKLMLGQADASIDFDEIVGYLDHLGFAKRIRGSHYIFRQNCVAEQVNLQRASDGKAKIYQVRQVRDILVRYKLGSSEDEI